MRRTSRTVKVECKEAIDGREVVRMVTQKEYELLLKRFRHLLESEIIRLYDEVDPRTGEYKRDIKELDNIIFKINNTYPRSKKIVF